jgi:hypothetical protein
MIDSQSSRFVAVLRHRPDSPKGCWKLAGGNTPGKPSHYPRALKGRRKALISSAASSSLCLRASASFALASIRVLVRPCQPAPNPFGVPGLFAPSCKFRARALAALPDGKLTPLQTKSRPKQTKK